MFELLNLNFSKVKKMEIKVITQVFESAKILALSKTYVILIFTSCTTQKLSVDLRFIYNLKIYNLIY